MPTGKHIKRRRLTADFETIVNKDFTRIWAFATCDIDNTDNFTFGTTIEELIGECKEEPITLYFHNLKFDGEFIISWLFDHGYKHSLEKEPRNNEFTTLISDTGNFYSISIGTDNETIKIYDSLKILPFKVEEIAEAFNLPISKLKIDYEEYREENHILTPQEKDYIKNDVQIVALALATLFKEGLNKITQGSNALYDFKRIFTTKKFKRCFPTPEYDSEIRPSYKGGFTYLNPRFKNKVIKNGIVLDVNSLYPSVMYYCALPYGEGIKFYGKYETDNFYNLYVQCFRCQFKLKKDHIPTIQLKGNMSFIQNEYVTSSNGEDVTLYLTNIDLELFFCHYDVFNIEYFYGWKFKSTTGMFTEYIDKWNGIKVQATIDKNKAMRTLAKLMLNALYGKFALNPNVCSKIPYMESGIVKYKLGTPETRKPIYIPVGTFITSHARYKTITSAQTVYERFAYADTDSLHLEGLEEPENLEISPTKLGAWKHESTFRKAKFLRQKCYIEETLSTEKEIKEFLEKYPDLKHLVTNDSIMSITCAGMPQACYNQVTFDNFKIGNSYGGKLKPTHVKGGIVLKNIDFSLRP